jgi:chromosome segregation ATPase
MLNSATVSAFVAVAGIALTIVALLASWRVSRRSVSTQVYRDTASAWEAKSKAQDAENADLRAQLATRDERIADLTGRVTVLQDTVTGARAWDSLERRTAEMLALAAETRAETRRIHEAVDAGLGQLGGLTENCSQVVDRLTRLVGGREEDRDGRE